MRGSNEFFCGTRQKLKAQLQSKDQTDDRIDHLCDQNQDLPYSSVLIVQEMNRINIESSGTFQTFGPQAVQSANNLRNVVLFSAAVFARFKMKGAHAFELPPGRNAQENWLHNIGRPHIDHDNAFTNYVAHPYGGSVYYLFARHEGNSILRSFAFSAFSSMFVWEFGIEGVYQQPSINDMIATPVIGSILGEVFYQIFEAIEKNDGRVLGSPALGTIVQVITNPGYFLSQGFDELLGANWFKGGNVGYEVQRPQARWQSGVPTGPQLNANRYMFRLQLLL